MAITYTQEDIDRVNKRSGINITVFIKHRSPKSLRMSVDILIVLIWLKRE